MSLFSRKAYDKLITIRKIVGCPCSLVSYSHFSADRAQYQDKSAMFLMCACTRAPKMTPYIMHRNDAECKCEESP